MKTLISIGDVCVDLAQGSKVQVVDVAADTAEEYREENDMDLTTYKSHPLFGVEENDRVLRCVYLGDSLKSLPSGSYDFPESRLARIPVEEVAEDVYPPVQAVKMELFDRIADFLVYLLEEEPLEEASISEEEANLIRYTIDDVLTPSEREWWQDSWDIAVEFTMEEESEDA